MSSDEKPLEPVVDAADHDHEAHNHENCLAIYEVEENSPIPRASFVGRIGDAPGCATMIANALSQQSIHEVNLLLEEATGQASDLLVSFDSLNVSLGRAAYPYVQPPALDALRKAIDARGQTMRVNSAYRTLAQQHLLYRWWNFGAGRCNFQAVAPPGSSFHQAGLAIDIEDVDAWRPYLERNDWQWYGSGDYPHFTYVGSGRVLSINVNGRAFDIRNTATLAFQRLWNRNHPNDVIAEDGTWGGNTKSKLNLSPAYGFDQAPWDSKPRVLRLSTPRLEGSDVEQLQQRLKEAGIELAVDGVFGVGTDTAVRAYQEKQAMPSNGVVSVGFFPSDPVPSDPLSPDPLPSVPPDATLPIPVVPDPAPAPEEQPTTEVSGVIRDVLKRGELGASLKLVVEMIEEGRPNRPGTPITVKKITVHNTSNANRGADAKAHSNWVRNTGFYEVKRTDEEGNETVKKTYVSWHYTVDDKRVIKHLPISERGWHAGSRANASSLGVEICMHEGIDQTQAFDRAARLIAVLLYDLNLSIEDVVTHKYWTGKNCPVLLLEGDRWKTFTEQIESYLQGAQVSRQADDDEDV